MNFLSATGSQARWDLLHKLIDELPDELLDSILIPGTVLARVLNDRKSDEL